jgi:LmbE family N-acetylglucosaminyl deacetylase
MKTVLAIGAHPDDIEIGCAGTECLLKRQGYSLVHLMLTSGDEGSLSIPRAQLVAQREHEASAAAKVLGVDEVIFMRQPDGLTSFSKQLKVDLIRVIRRLKPEIVFVHASSDTFLDHSVTRELTLAALRGAGGPWYPDAGHEPHVVPTVLGYEVWHPMSVHQMAVNIEDSFQTKVDALNCHFSQVADVDYVAAVRGLAEYRGALTMKGKQAEVFEILRADTLLF